MLSLMLLVPVLLPTIVVQPVHCWNESDVYVRYEGHAEAGGDDVTLSLKVESTSVVPTIVTTPTTTPQTTKKPTTTQVLQEETEGVVFIPNAPPVERVEDEEEEERGIRLHELFQKKDVNDLLGKHYRVETEAPNEIFFVTDKNRDIPEDRSREEKKSRKKKNRKEVEPPISPLDCEHLDCNNTIKSICGAKTVNRILQHRLFLNDCYFRKVNCNFKYEINRYEEVPLERCQKIGGHLDERPFSFKPKYHDEPKDKTSLSARRSFISRRSMAMNMDGRFCSHPCPVSCPDDYEPECAVSATGQRKVFMNHCKLDDNSCLFSVVWHKRPLSECVGGKKADMRQNRFFIGWMQRVGILDNKGKLVLE